MSGTKPLFVRLPADVDGFLTRKMKEWRFRSRAAVAVRMLDFARQYGDDDPVAYQNFDAWMQSARRIPDQPANPAIPKKDLPGAVMVPLFGKRGTSAGLYVWVSAEDAPRTLLYRWFLNPHKTYKGNTTYYPATYINGKQVLLHRFILQVSETAVIVDHADGDTLDCRRCNLRACTPAQNSANKKHWNPTGFKGVTQMGSGRFSATIRANGVSRYLGSFDHAEAAARAYDAAAVESFGEFARLNFPATPSEATS